MIADADIPQLVGDYLTKLDLVTDPKTRPAGASGADIIKSDALDLNKYVATGIGAAGGISSIAIAIKGFLAGLGDATGLAFVLAAGAIIVVSAVSMAWIVTTDTRIRDRLERARIESRSQAVESFAVLLHELNSQMPAQQLASTIPLVPPTLVRGQGEAETARRVVFATRWESDKIELLTIDPLKRRMEWIDAAQVDQYFVAN